MIISKTAYVDATAVVIGDVVIGEYSSVFPNATIRGDKNIIKIGNKSNIQDNCVLHTTENSTVEIGDYVSIGHGAILHGCKIKNNCI